MVPISSLNSRIFEKKKGFKNFAWALGYGDIMGQTFDTFFWILYWISRLLIPNMGLGKTGEDHLRVKNWSKIRFYGGWNCVGWHEIKWIPLILYMKLISVKSWTLWVILRIKNPRLLVPPTLFQKLSEIFKNRFPRELDQNFDILRISMIHWIRYNFLKYINRPRKKVKSIFNPGIQPNYVT